MTGVDDIGGSRLTLLARAGELLSSPGAGEQTLERLVGLLVPGLAQWCAIDVLREDGSIDRVATAPADGPQLHHEGPHGPAVVMRTGEPELLRRVDPDFFDGLDSSSYMCVPLIARDRPWGTITLLRTGEAPGFGRIDVELAADLARRAATAIENARLMQSLASSEERYRLLFDANPPPMWVYDAGTLGIPRRQPGGRPALRPFARGVPRDDRPRHPPSRGRRRPARRTWPSRPPGSRRRGRGVHRKKDGTLIDVEITAPRSRSGPGRRAWCSANDVTERAAARGAAAGRRRRWRPSAGSPAASPTTSTTC